MQHAVLAAFPQADLGVSLVWLPMLSADSVVEARTASALVPDPRVRHFYDPQQRTARAVGASVGWATGQAWDIYLFYGPGRHWGAAPPVPQAWLHQLGEHQADGHFHCGADLWLHLHQTAQQLVDAPG